VKPTALILAMPVFSLVAGQPQLGHLQAAAAAILQGVGIQQVTFSKVAAATGVKSGIVAEATKVPGRGLQVSTTETGMLLDMSAIGGGRVLVVTGWNTRATEESDGILLAGTVQVIPLPAAATAEAAVFVTAPFRRMMSGEFDPKMTMAAILS
jgi:hypothetical protein